MMKHQLFLGILLICLFAIKARAQTESKQTDTTSIENIRGQSGIDPIIIHSKVIYNLFVLDSKGPSGRITNAAAIAFGVRRWGISLKGSVVSVLSGNPGEGFRSATGDINLALQNNVYARGKHALAVSGELGLPTGKLGYGNQYFSFTPALTYIYTIKPSMIMALQPQYSFHLMKDPIYPDLSQLTVRVLFAKYTRTGNVYGMELKPTINFQSNILKLFITPFVSKSLGAGFNLLFLCDLPANKSAINEGPTYRLGINRNF
jgi:hypothetical protein